MIALNRIHLILLSILSKSEATSAGKAITTEYINQFCPIGKSYTTLHRAIHFLENNQYISSGVKDGKFNTYFITEDGIRLLKEVL